MTPTWTPKHVVNQVLAKELIQTQFPALAPVTIKPLGFGWDNTVYRVNQDYAFRFPRREVALTGLQAEIALLGHLAPSLPLPIPFPHFVGRQSKAFPWPFAGFSFLEGCPACQFDLSDEARNALAVPLAEFLKTLHGLTATLSAQNLIPEPGGTYFDLDERIPAVHHRLVSVEEKGWLTEGAALRQYVQEMVSAHLEQDLVLVHGDFYLRHFLLNPKGRLAGIIDWGDLHLGQRAADLSVLYTFLPKTGRKRFVQTYGPINKNTLRLAKLRAINYAGIFIEYGNQEQELHFLREGHWITRNLTAEVLFDEWDL